MKEIKEYIEQYSKLLPLAKSISVPEAERRAGEFLAAIAQITEWRHEMSEVKIKTTSVQAATYSQELSKAAGKTITENKITVEASAEYTAVREELEYCENDLSYLKAYADIFTAAHVFYRNMAKGEGY